MSVKVKRIYDAPDSEDGKRILVDRLWPRGISKERASLDIWLKEIAPSPKLRTWYAHKPERHEEFRSLYEHELSVDQVHREMVDYMCKLVSEGDVTLLYAAKDPVHNHAVILLDLIKHKLEDKKLES